MKSIYIACYLFLYSLLSSAQFYTSGADPASTKWRFVESKHFKLVFPEEFDAKSSDMINYLEHAFLKAGYSLNGEGEKLEVVIHSKSYYSNGLVTWAPKRMEIYPVPHQDIYGQEWLQQLAIHELRHVYQISKIDRGSTEVASYFWGEQAIGAILGLYVPMWFLEGDATYTETALSEYGRGRMPSFEQGLKALTLEKKINPYAKAYLGSFNDYVPDYYQMGYHLVAHVRQKYGSDPWKRGLTLTGDNPFWPNPFARGVKKTTGKRLRPLYNEAMAAYKEQWESADSALEKSPFSEIRTCNDGYYSIKQIEVLDESRFVCEVEGPGTLKHFSLINKEGKETVLCYPGTRTDEPFSISDKYIVWSELKHDVRWPNRYYSCITKYSIETEEVITVTSRGNYFSPSLSVDNKTIVAVKVDEGNKYSLVVIDALNHEIVTSISTPKNQFVITPSYSADGSKVVMILLTEAGKKISTYHLQTGEWEDVTSPLKYNVRRPRLYGETLYYSSSQSGIENIVAFNIHTKERVQLTSARFGARNISISNDSTFYYNNYTSDGYKIARSSFNAWKRTINNDSIVEPVSCRNLLKDEKGIVTFDSLAFSSTPSRKYSKWNLFRIHSWAPQAINVEDETVDQGVSIFSQNLLGTSIASIGYNSNPNSTTEKYFFNYKYTGLFPEFSFSAKYGDLLNHKYYEELQSSTMQYFKTLSGKISIPLNFDYGKYNRSIISSGTLNYRSSSKFTYVRNDAPSITYISPEQTYKYFDYSLYAYNVQKRTKRDADVRWGQTLDLFLRDGLSGSISDGRLLGVLGKIFIPSPINYHTFKVGVSYQKQLYSKAYYNDYYGSYLPQRFNTIFSYSRGYEGYANRSSDELTKYSADYVFPLVNPDLPIGSLVYLKRIKMNVFHDFTKEKQYTFSDETHYSVSTEYFQSTGFEVHFQFHLFQNIVPMEMGYRYSILHQLDNSFNSILFNINLSQF